MIGIIMFFASVAMLLYGFPVAFTLAAVSLLFGVIAGIVEVGFDDGVWQRCGQRLETVIS